MEVGVAEVVVVVMLAEVIVEEVEVPRTRHSPASARDVRWQQRGGKGCSGGCSGF